MMSGEQADRGASNEQTAAGGDESARSIRRSSPPGQKQSAEWGEAHLVKLELEPKGGGRWWPRDEERSQALLSGHSKGTSPCCAPSSVRQPPCTSFEIVALCRVSET
jgi:hypothetical protein